MSINWIETTISVTDKRGFEFTNFFIIAHFQVPEYDDPCNETPFPSVYYPKFEYSANGKFLSAGVYDEEEATESEELTFLKGLRISSPINYKQDYTTANLQQFLQFISAV